MRGPAPPPESAEMVLEVLLKLPTRDVARCRCVCRLWRGVIAEPTFSSLHAEAETNGNHASVASEALLVTETWDHGRPAEAIISIVSSSTPKPMPHRITIPSGYSLSNVCNGLLCFASYCAEAPAFICNPVTGETATLPTPMVVPGVTASHHYALGFSPSTKEHKLFRFSSSYNSTLWNKIDQSVCTLGGSVGGWRRRSYTSRSSLVRTLPPVLVDGSLYLVTSGRTSLGQCRKPDEMLVVDVATEAHRRCRLPIVTDDENFNPTCDPPVHAFEMSGRLCLAVKTLCAKYQFWVMSLPPPDQWVEGDDSKLWWDLRYSFYFDDHVNRPTGAWFDDGTLCFRHGDVLLKHGTRGRSPELSPDADCPQCDRRLQLPPTPSKCRWNIIGGYRPSLLSPLTLATPPSSWDAEEERQEFHHAMFLALRRNE